MAGVPRNQMVVDPIMIAAWDARASFRSHEELDAEHRQRGDEWNDRMANSKSAPDVGKIHDHVDVGGKAGPNAGGHVPSHAVSLDLCLTKPS